jgi:antitoxin component of RelBE/YafQ-DinJ toxin-antitoxin module
MEPRGTARLHVRIDDDIRKSIRLYAKQNGITISQAARELLRQAIGAPAAPIDRGWREGFIHGHRVYRMEQAKRDREGIAPAARARTVQRRQG